jgi:hypothetical protein
MNILYIDSGNRLGENYTYRYYGDLYRELCKNHNVNVFQGIPKNILPLTAGKEYDCIIFGLGYFAQRDPSAYLKIEGLCNLDISVVCLVHKQQIMIKEKLYFCKINNIDLLVDPHVSYKKFGDLLSVKSTRFWFSADTDIFHDRDVEKIYDIGFSGASHGDGKIKGPTADLRDRVYNELKNTDYNLFWNRQTSPSHRISSMEEYATKINESKIWIATTGPIMDVSPRYFEVILSKTLLFCNRMEDEYEGIFRDGENCVMYENDLSDFQEKIKFYLDNDDERNKIIKRAYDEFIEKYTSKHMCENLINEIKELNCE